MFIVVALEAAQAGIADGREGRLWPSASVSG